MQDTVQTRIVDVPQLFRDQSPAAQLEDCSYKMLKLLRFCRCRKLVKPCAKLKTSATEIISSD